MNAEQIRGTSLRILILSSQGIFLRRIDMIKQFTIETELERWTFVSYQQLSIPLTWVQNAFLKQMKLIWINVRIMKGNFVGNKKWTSDYHR